MSMTNLFHFEAPCPNDSLDAHTSRHDWDPDDLQEEIDAGTLVCHCVTCDHHWQAPDEQIDNLKKLLAEWRRFQAAPRK